MSGRILFSQSLVFISLAILLAVQLSLAVYLPTKYDHSFCHDRLDGDYEYPAPNCSLYYTCSNQNTFVRECAPKNLYFSQGKGFCDWPINFPDEKQYDCMGTPAEDRTSRVPVSTTTTEATSNEPEQPLPTPSDDPFCHDKEDGRFEYPLDCGKFYNCANQHTWIMDCVEQLWFNETTDSCEYQDSFTEEVQERCRGLINPEVLPFDQKK